MPRRPGPPSPVQLSPLAPPAIHLVRDFLKAEVSAHVRAGAWERVRPGAYVESITATDTFERTGSR